MKKRSPSSTNSTAQINKYLSSDDVCLIIEICHKAQVSVLEFGDLRVTFRQATQAPEPEAPTHSRAHPVSPTQDLPQAADNAISVIQKQSAQESLEHDEARLRDEQVAMLLIEDPQQAEQLLIDEKLDEDTTDGSGDSEEA